MQSADPTPPPEEAGQPQAPQGGNGAPPDGGGGPQNAGSSASTLAAVFLARAEEGGDEPFLWQRVPAEDGAGAAWTSRSWRETRAETEALAAALQGLGLKAGARALIISENRPEFLIAELAALRLGAAASFGYMTGTEGDFAHLLRGLRARRRLPHPERSDRRALSCRPWCSHSPHS